VGVVLKFISTGIGAVTPMRRDAENRCIAGHTMDWLLHPCYTERTISFSSPTGIEMRFRDTSKKGGQKNMKFLSPDYSGIVSHCTWNRNPIIKWTHDLQRLWELHRKTFCPCFYLSTGHCSDHSRTHNVKHQTVLGQ
jgi:hypothetical protein